MGKAYEDMISS